MAHKTEGCFWPLSPVPWDMGVRQMAPRCHAQPKTLGATYHSSHGLHIGPGPQPRAVLGRALAIDYSFSKYFYYYHFDYDYLFSGQGRALKCFKKRMSGMTRFLSSLRMGSMFHISLTSLKHHAHGAG